MRHSDHDPDVIYMENSDSALYLERPEQAARFNTAFNHLRAAALAPGPSLDMIRELLD